MFNTPGVSSICGTTAIGKLARQVFNSEERISPTGRSPRNRRPPSLHTPKSPKHPKSPVSPISPGRKSPRRKSRISPPAQKQILTR